MKKQFKFQREREMMHSTKKLCKKTSTREDLLGEV